MLAKKKKDPPIAPDCDFGTVNTTRIYNVLTSPRSVFFADGCHLIILISLLRQPGHGGWHFKVLYDTDSVPVDAEHDELDKNRLLLFWVAFFHVIPEREWHSDKLFFDCVLPESNDDILRGSEEEPLDPTSSFEVSRNTKRWETLFTLGIECSMPYATDKILHSSTKWGLSSFDNISSFVASDRTSYTQRRIAHLPSQYSDRRHTVCHMWSIVHHWFHFRLSDDDEVTIVEEVKKTKQWKSKLANSISNHIYQFIPYFIVSDTIVQQRLKRNIEKLSSFLRNMGIENTKTQEIQKKHIDYGSCTSNCELMNYHTGLLRRMKETVMMDESCIHYSTEWSAWSLSQSELRQVSKKD